MLLSVLAVLVVLSPIVIIHEFGHYLACRLTGIRVNEFSFVLEFVPVDAEIFSN